MKTAYVTKSAVLRDILQETLTDGNKAFMVGAYRSGYKFDRIVLLTRIRSDIAKNWFGHFKCYLAVDGEVIHISP
jgi:hypothetical protein